MQFNPNLDAPGQSQDVYDLMISLGLTKADINKMYSIFAEIDADSSGQINR